MRGSRGGFLLFTAVIMAVFGVAIATAQDQKQVAEGKAVYDTYCVICHGENGDGKGLIGIVSRAQTNGLVVYTYPRDFTAGVYKFRSTSTGDLPTNEDLLNTVTEGISRSGMPSHKELSPKQASAVVGYIKTFSRRWAEEQPGTPIKMSKSPDYLGTKASIARGKQLYEDAGCFNCRKELDQILRFTPQI